MNAKEYLSQIELINVRIQNRKEEIQTLKSYLNRTTISTEKDYIQYNGSGSKVENQTVKITDLEKCNSEEILKLSMKRDEIISVIESLDNPMYERILYLRYCQNKTWEEIGEDIDKSYQWVNELHERALKKIEKIINNT